MKYELAVPAGAPIALTPCVNVVIRQHTDPSEMVLHLRVEEFCIIVRVDHIADCIADRATEASCDDEMTQWSHGNAATVAVPGRG